MSFISLSNKLIILIDKTSVEMAEITEVLQIGLLLGLSPCKLSIENVLWSIYLNILFKDICNVHLFI